jgi:hypothetical protein
MWYPNTYNNNNNIMCMQMDCVHHGIRSYKMGGRKRTNEVGPFAIT